MQAIFAMFLFAVVGLPLTVVLGLLTSFLTRRRPRSGLAFGVATAVVPLSFLYLAGAVWVSSGYLSLRGLDRGMFDDYITPLGHGYNATSVDTADDPGELSGPGLSGPAWNVVRSGCAGPLVVLQLFRVGPAPSYAVLDGAASLRPLPTLADLESSVGGPIEWSGDREPPAACAPRLLWIDTLVRTLLFGLPLAWLVGTVLLIWTVRRVPGAQRLRDGGFVVDMPNDAGPPVDHRVPAGLALTLGAFGVHKSLQGQYRSADIRRSVSLTGGLLGFLVLPLLAVWIMTLVAVVEGVLLLRRRGTGPVRAWF